MTIAVPTQCSKLGRNVAVRVPKRGAAISQHYFIGTSEDPAGRVSHRAVERATEARSIGLMSINAIPFEAPDKSTVAWGEGSFVMKNRIADTRARDVDTSVDVAQWWSPPIMSVALKAGETCAAWNGEVLRFASDRLRRDSEFGFALAKCRSWSEAAELQRDWTTKTTQDYFEEGHRLLRLATRAGTDIAETTSEKA